MPRWEPDAPGRLQHAAMELFVERGYDAATVEDIAARAGVTKRTFFRHFPDKREVLFGGGEAFARLFVDTLAAQPAGTAPLDAVAAALDAVGRSFAGRHEHARLRSRVIAAHPELQERELVKLASVAAAMTSALHDRGVPDPVAAVCAETGMAVFRTAFEAWTGGDAVPDLATRLDEALAALRLATAGHG